MALTDAQWADAVALAVSRFHAGITTEAQMSAEIKAATEGWPTRTLSNAALAIKISRSLANLTGLIESVGPPDPDAGTIGAMAFDNIALSFYGPKTEAGWGPERPIDAGPPGPAIEMRVSGGFIQWRVVGEPDWINLISVADLTGSPGEEVSLQVTATHIQWRLGTGPWQDLIAISALKGADGREVQMQASATHIQWRYAGESAWTDIIALSDLTGATGNAAWTPVIATVVDGERRVQQIVDWTGGGGTKPATGKYIGPMGLVDTPAEATDVRGAGGSGSGDVMGPGASIDGGLVAFDGSTGIKIKAGPGIGVTNAGDLLRRSDGDARYRAAGAVPQSDVTGLTAALGDKADLVGGKVPAAQLATATVAQVRAGKASGVVIEPDEAAGAMAFTALTDAATVAIDLDTGPNFTLTTTAVVGAGRTIGAPSNGNVGQYYTIRFTAHAGATVAWNTAFKWPGGTAQAITNTAGAITEVAFKMISASRFDVVGFVKDIR